MPQNSVNCKWIFCRKILFDGENFLDFYEKVPLTKADFYDIIFMSNSRSA